MTTERPRHSKTSLAASTSTSTITSHASNRIDRSNVGNNQVLLKARKMSGNKKTYSANRLRAKVPKGRFTDAAFDVFGGQLRFCRIRKFSNLPHCNSLLQPQILLV